MVFTTNTLAFAEEVAVDSVDTVEAAGEVVVDTYTGDGKGRQIGRDIINTNQYSQVPDNWNVNADPKDWDTATALVSTNDVELLDVDDLRNTTDWAVLSPFSYFFGSCEDNRLVDGKVVYPAGRKLPHPHPAYSRSSSFFPCQQSL